jgi:hypothetical protein
VEFAGVASAPCTRGINMQADEKSAISRRQLVKLGAAAGTVALGAVGLPTPAIATTRPSSPGRAQSGAAGDRSRPRSITNDAVQNTVGYADWQGINGFLSLNTVTQGVYCTGGFLMAPLDVPPGARFAGLTALGSSTGGQSWFVEAQDFLAGSTLGVANGSTSAGSYQSVAMIPTTQFTVNTFVRLFVQVTPTGDSSNVAHGVNYFYVPARPAFYAVSPARVYDSRLSGGPINSGQTRTISVATSTTSTAVVPASASAVLYNLTVTNNSGAGYLALFPTGTTWPGNSSINFVSSTVANGGMVTLGGDRQVNVFCSGTTTDFIVDITGYYL